MLCSNTYEIAFVFVDLLGVLGPLRAAARGILARAVSSSKGIIRYDPGIQLVFDVEGYSRLDYLEPEM